MASVFEAFTEPRHLSVWFTKEADADLRPGGRYSNSDNDKGEFLEIDPPHRVRFTWENENHCPGTEVDVRFETQSATTARITLNHSLLSGRDEIAEMKEGWSWALESLRSYLESGKPITFEDWKAKTNGGQDSVS